jgi:hypothetical protein
MIKNHPHYYVYFNQLVGNDWDDKWDRDIWRLSTKQSLEELIKNESSRSKPLLIYKDYATYINSWIIKGEFRKNIIFVDDLATAEYRILDYRNKIGDYPDEIPPHFIKYKTIDVDNKPISAIYIKNELVEN